MDEFSAAFYGGWSENQLRVEAEKLGISVYGLSRRQMIDAVYNAELRRRSVQSEETEVVEEPSTEDAPVGYDSMTRAQLRDRADERGVDLTGITRRDDIIAALRADDDRLSGYGPESEAGKLDEATEK